jgi:hypothetical protein
MELRQSPAWFLQKAARTLLSANAPQANPPQANHRDAPRAYFMRA